MLFQAFIVLLSLILGVFCNTEILNFDVGDVGDKMTSMKASWATLDAVSYSGTYRIPPALFGTPLKQVCEGGTQLVCPHELWFVLDLRGSWETYHKFTLRISYPAFFPADFRIDLYDPPQSSHRLKYARIRAVDTGVLTPSPTSAQHVVEPVPFNLILEPLYLGVLPASLVPTITYLVILAGAAYLAFPSIHSYLHGVAQPERGKGE